MLAPNRPWSDGHIALWCLLFVCQRVWRWAASRYPWSPITADRIWMHRSARSVAAHAQQSRVMQRSHQSQPGAHIAIDHDVAPPIPARDSRYEDWWYIVLQKVTQPQPSLLFAAVWLTVCLTPITADTSQTYATQIAPISLSKIDEYTTQHASFFASHQPTVKDFPMDGTAQRITTASSLSIKTVSTIISSRSYALPSHDAQAGDETEQ